MGPTAAAKADPNADPWYYGGYYGLGHYGYGLGHHGYWGRKKRSADPTPAADPKADPYYYYGLGHYGLGHGLGYYGGYGHYLYGKRSADPTPDPTADPKVTPTFSMAMDTPTTVDTMAITCMERGLPTLLLLLTLRLTPTFSMATTAMATAILTMV